MDQTNNAETYKNHTLREQIFDRKGIVACGRGFTVAVGEDKTIYYAGDDRYEQSRCLAWKDVVGVFCGPDYILGLGGDGTVSGAGRNTHGQLNVSNWAGVSLIACGATHAAALQGSGRVFCTGDTGEYTNTGDWTDIVDICCGRGWTVGLCRDGRLRVAGGTGAMHHRLSKWRDVVGIFSDYDGEHVYGITAEGRLISTEKLPSYTAAWTNIVSVAVAGKNVCAITAEGLALPRREKKRSTRADDARPSDTCLAVIPGDRHMIYLRQNGMVRGSGNNDFGQADTNGWSPLFEDFQAFANGRRADPEQISQRNVLYQQRLSEAERYGYRLACGERMTACLAVDGRVNVTAPFAEVKQWEQIRTITCGGTHVLGLHRDGHVSADGNNVHDCCHVAEWTHVKDIWAGKYHSLALTEDGRVLFAGWNHADQGDVTGWKDIRLLRATETYTVGMDLSGRWHVAGTDFPFDPTVLASDDWRDVIDVSLSEHHIAGLKKNGRVVFEGDAYCGAVRDVKETVGGWRGVRTLASGNGFVVGLCYGGHVVAAGRNHVGQCETDTWRQVVSIGCGYAYTAALTVEGTVLTAGKQRYPAHSSPISAADLHDAAPTAEHHPDYAPCRTDGWKDVLTMACGPHHLVAVDRYGHVYASGLDQDRQCSLAGSFAPFKEVRQLDDYGRYLTTARPTAPDGNAGDPT